MTGAANRVPATKAKAKAAQSAPSEPKVLEIAAPPSRPAVPAVTAAARRINLTTRDGRKLLERCPQKWQDEAWAYFGVLPEVAFGAGFQAKAMGRVRWFPAVFPSADEPPVPLEDAAGEVDGVTAELAEAAREELARLSAGSDGLPGLKQAFGLNLSVAGEAYLVGRDADGDDDLDDEVWGVYSSAAFKVKGDKVTLQGSPNGPKTLLPDDVFFARVWRRDPQWPDLPWSNMRASLDTAEELLLHSRRLRAIAKSGTNAGALKVPEEIDLPERPRADDQGDVDPTAVGQGEKLTKFERDFVDWAISAVEDDGSAAQVAPWLMRAAYQYIDRIEWIDFARTIDEKIVERIDHLIDRLSHGLDLPVEILKGLAASNHWSAWLISDDAYRAHVEPLDQIAARGVASSFLRPALLERGFPVEAVRQVVLGLDPSDLVVRPNRAQDAKDGHDRWALSDDALRTALGFADSDAPDDEELLRRMALRRSSGSPELTGVLLEETGLVEDLPEDLGTASTEGTESGPDDVDDAVGGGEPVPATLEAAGFVTRAIEVAKENGSNGHHALTAARPVPEIGPALTAIEPRLRERLTVAASQAVTDALRKAGNRLKGAAQGHPELAERVKGKPAEEIGLILGAVVATELADPDRLLEGAFDDLAAQWDAWVTQAQSEIATVFERHVDDAADPDLARTALDRYQSQQEEDRSAGWVVFAGLIVQFTTTRLFRGADEMVTGEHDPATIVDQGIAREALARAGGGSPGLAPAGSGASQGPGGLTTGPRIMETLAGFGMRPRGWRWSTGLPTRPFEPHQRLSGTEFTSWDDERLANPGTWPSSPFLWPGDHRGCMCDASPLVEVDVRATAATAA